MERFNLSERQAQAILDMRLQRLTGLERDKIEDEYTRTLVKLIEELKFILADEVKSYLKLYEKKLRRLKIVMNDKRRTEIVAGGAEMIEDEDLIPVKTLY